MLMGFGVPHAWACFAHVIDCIFEKRVRIGESILANTHPLAWVGFIKNA